MVRFIGQGFPGTIVSMAPSPWAHAKRGGFPADRISEIKEVIDPTTGE
jgi:hypothetical protein